MVVLRELISNTMVLLELLAIVLPVIAGLELTTLIPVPLLLMVLLVMAVVEAFSRYIPLPLPVMVLPVIVTVEFWAYTPVSPLPVIVQFSIRLVEDVNRTPHLLLFLIVHPVIVGEAPAREIPSYWLCSIILSVTVIEELSIWRLAEISYARPPYRITTLSKTLFLLVLVKCIPSQSPRAGVLPAPSPFVSPPTVSSLKEVK
jgi:hypothetical protein